MKNKIIFIAIICLFAGSTVSAAGTLRSISDGIARGINLTALGSSLYYEEIEETGAWVLQITTQELFVIGAKKTMGSSSLGERPSHKGKDGKSYGFISSHVSFTTGAAIKLWEIYPDNIFVKTASTAAVGVVIYERIQSDSHSVIQTGLGVGTAFLFNYLGDIVTDYFQSENNLNWLHLSQKERQSISFQLTPPERGQGLAGMITWKF